jgi:hypothetical protein
MLMPRTCRDEDTSFEEQVAQNWSVCAQLLCRGGPIVSGNNRRSEIVVELKPTSLLVTLCNHGTLTEPDIV